MQMSRRPINFGRRSSGSEISAPSQYSVNSRSNSSRCLSILAVFLGMFLIVGYLYHGKGNAYLIGTIAKKEAISTPFTPATPTTPSSPISVSSVEGEYSCLEEVKRAIPILKEAYGDGMRKVLHVGPDTCSVVSKLIREEETEAWGVEPYDIEDVDSTCKSLVRRGLVRVVDIMFPLPYREKSFSLVIVSDALDYLSPKYLNRTIPELLRVSSDGLAIFSRNPRQSKTKTADRPRKGQTLKSRNQAWWTKYFDHLNLVENTAVVDKLSKAAQKTSHSSGCQSFHLKPSH